MSYPGMVFWHFILTFGSDTLRRPHWFSILAFYQSSILTSDLASLVASFLIFSPAFSVACILIFYIYIYITVSKESQHATTPQPITVVLFISHNVLSSTMFQRSTIYIYICMNLFMDIYGIYSDSFTCILSVWHSFLTFIPVQSGMYSDLFLASGLPAANTKSLCALALAFESWGGWGGGRGGGTGAEEEKEEEEEDEEPRNSDNIHWSSPGRWGKIQFRWCLSNVLFCFALLNLVFKIYGKYSVTKLNQQQITKYHDLSCWTPDTMHCENKKWIFGKKK